MRRWDALVEAYMRECATRGVGEATRRNRDAELARWGWWLKGRRPRPALEGINTDHVAEYLRKRAAFRAKATLASVMSHLRGMGEYLVREGHWKSNPLRWMRGPKMSLRSRLPRRIGRQHLIALWKAAGEKPAGFPRALTMGMLSVLYGTGVRRGELERMNLKDWSREERTLRVDGRKTGQERLTPVHPRVAQYLEAYLPYRQNALEKAGHLDEPALFIGKSGHRMRGEYVGQIIHRLAKQANVPLVSVHQFRHTCASDLIEEGVSLPQVQQMLGHSAIRSTMWYLSISDPALKLAIQKHPLNAFLEEISAKGGCHEFVRA
jgi:integrase/recombinase XerC